MRVKNRSVVSSVTGGQEMTAMLNLYSVGSITRSAGNEPLHNSQVEKGILMVVNVHKRMKLMKSEGVAVTSHSTWLLEIWWDIGTLRNGTERNSHIYLTSIEILINLSFYFFIIIITHMQMYNINIITLQYYTNGIPKRVT